MTSLTFFHLRVEKIRRMKDLRSQYNTGVESQSNSRCDARPTLSVSWYSNSAITIYCRQSYYDTSRYLTEEYKMPALHILHRYFYLFIFCLINVVKAKVGHDVRLIPVSPTLLTAVRQYNFFFFFSQLNPFHVTHIHVASANVRSHE